MNNVPLPEIDDIELMLAVIGIKPIVSRAVEKVRISTLHSMADIAKDVESKARGLIEGEAEPSAIQPVSYKQTLKELTQGWDVNQVMEMISQFPGEYKTKGLALVVKSQAIISSMLKDYPIQTYQTATGQTMLKPSDTRMFRFQSVLQVIDKPLTVFDLIATGAIRKSQVKAMRVIYPTLSKAIDSSIFNAIVKKKSQLKSYQLPARAEYGLRTWAGQPPLDKSSLLNAQKTYEDSKQDKKGSGPGPSSASGSKPETTLMTQEQKVTASLA